MSVFSNLGIVGSSPSPNYVSSVGPKPLETDNSSGSLETDNSEETLEAVNWRWFGNQTLGITRNRFSGAESRKKPALKADLLL